MIVEICNISAISAVVSLALTSDRRDPGHWQYAPSGGGRPGPGPRVVRIVDEARRPEEVG